MKTNLNLPSTNRIWDIFAQSPLIMTPQELSVIGVRMRDIKLPSFDSTLIKELRKRNTNIVPLSLLKEKLNYDEITQFDFDITYSPEYYLIERLDLKSNGLNFTQQTKLLQENFKTLFGDLSNHPRVFEMDLEFNKLCKEFDLIKPRSPESLQQKNEIIQKIASCEINKKLRAKPEDLVQWNTYNYYLNHGYKDAFSEYDEVVTAVPIENENDTEEIEFVSYQGMSASGNHIFDSIPFTGYCKPLFCVNLNWINSLYRN